MFVFERKVAFPYVSNWHRLIYTSIERFQSSNQSEIYHTIRKRSPNSCENVRIVLTQKLEPIFNMGRWLVGEPVEGENLPHPTKEYFCLDLVVAILTSLVTVSLLYGIFLNDLRIENVQFRYKLIINSRRRTETPPVAQRERRYISKETH